MYITKSFSKTLQEILSQPAHLYIFYGQSGVGKKYIASYLASRLLGIAEHSDGTQIVNRNYMWVDVEEDKKNISIAQAKKAVEFSNKTNSNDGYKLIIVNNAELMSTQAANALLKTLEEPPSKTIFILLTQAHFALPITIRSRAQNIHFAPKTQQQITEFLIHSHGLDDERALAIATKAHGSFTRALTLSVNFSDEKSVDILQLAQNFLHGNLAGRFEIAKIVHEKVNPLEFLRELSYAISEHSAILEGANNNEKCLDAQAQMQSNVNTRLVLENLALHLEVKEN